MRELSSNEKVKSCLNIGNKDKQQLEERLMKWFESNMSENKDCTELQDSLKEILSDYDVSFNFSHSALMKLPEFVKIGNKVHIIKDDTEYKWDLQGEIIDIWYRMTAYTWERVSKVFDDINNVEYKSLSVYEETKPKIYTRIVVKDEKRGILIVPCIKELTIIEVGE